MLSLALRFFALFGTGLAAGATLCVLLAERTFDGDAAAYIAYKQLLIRALTVPIPLVAVIGIAGLLGDGYGLWRRGGGLPLWLVGGALLLNVVAGALTKAGHFPLNDQIMSWTPSTPPASWGAVRDSWARFHLARTLTTTASFVLVVVANLTRSAAP